MLSEDSEKANLPLSDTPYFVSCRVAPGMFRGEYLVYLDDTAAPQCPQKKVQVQLLVDEREVAGIQGTPKRNGPVPAWLRVALLEKHGDWANVVLPQPSQPLGECVLVGATKVNKAPEYDPLRSPH